MNRIILIGNGFDLAHGLPTEYRHFIENYWNEWVYNLRSYQLTRDINDELMHIQFESADSLIYYSLQIKSFDDLCSFLGSHGTLHSKCVSPFFENIYEAIHTHRWVDIENEYYKLLKGIIDKGKTYDSILKLNSELKALKQKLTTYLLKIQQEKITKSLVNDDISRIIFEPFNFKDISIRGKEAFIQFLRQRLNDGRDKQKVQNLIISKYGYRIGLEFFYDIEEYIKQVDAKKEEDYHEKTVMQNIGTIPHYFLLPEDILFLNFNYTQTADLYIPKTSGFRVNHIHGELENPDNPIIFGYGDEMDENYKKILNLNDNDYLENIKSIRYLETDNYRKLLQFIDSAPYQIYIMGHSCGNSDRTLLNTLFEHKNCISIKPYYRQKEDGTDNYIDIIQNISRNFNDMTLMRDRVVNKGYCKPFVTQ